MVLKVLFYFTNCFLPFPLGAAEKLFPSEMNKVVLNLENKLKKLLALISIFSVQF